MDSKYVSRIMIHTFILVTTISSLWLLSVTSALFSLLLLGTYYYVKFLRLLATSAFWVLQPFIKLSSIYISVLKYTYHLISGILTNENSDELINGYYKSENDFKSYDPNDNYRNSQESDYDIKYYSSKQDEKKFKKRNQKQLSFSTKYIHLNIQKTKVMRPGIQGLKQKRAQKYGMDEISDSDTSISDYEYSLPLNDSVDSAYSSRRNSKDYQN